jgi:hypothetical protein
MSETKPREVGRLRLPRIPKSWGAGGGAVTRARKESTLMLCVHDGAVHICIGYEEVVLDVEARDQFARLWMEAERAAEAQAGATP